MLDGGENRRLGWLFDERGSGGGLPDHAPGPRDVLVAGASDDHVELRLSLRDGALKVAHTDLEHEVARVKGGAEPTPEPLPVYTTEEIGQVARQKAEGFARLYRRTREDDTVDLAF
mgnify:CR=1 FL=1